MKYLTHIVLFALVINCNYSCKDDQKTTQLENVSTKSKANTFYKNNKETSTANTKSFDYLPKSTTGQIIYHNYYTLSYSEKYEQSEWVAYELKHQKSYKNQYKRPFFIYDKKVKTRSADWKNYKNSGYDKGHLCPAGDMKFSKIAYEETFLTSNISPQNHEFNIGIWNRLEEKTRYWSAKHNELFIITGGILRSNLSTIGKEKVAIPEYFYKIIFNKSNKNYKIISFLIPNKKNDKPLYNYVVSVDEIEKLSGIDFFPKMADSLESTLEKNKNYSNWEF